MLRSLLIGVNGSEWSQQAVRQGLEWARQMQVPVTCLGVVDVESLTAVEPVPMGGVAYKMERDAQMVAATHKKLEAALQQAQAEAGRLGVECRTRMVEGDAATELGNELQRHDLLIIGRRHVPTTDRDPPASATMADILRQAARPVVVAAGATTPASAVVIAYDGSQQAARTLKSFVASGLYYGHPLHLVGVSDHPAEMQTTLTRAVDYLAAHGQQAQVHLLPVGDSVGRTLCDFARHLPAGLLVAGVYGQSRLKELFFGSVTRSLISAAPVPMFLDH